MNNKGVIPVLAIGGIIGIITFLAGSYLAYKFGMSVLNILSSNLVVIAITVAVTYYLVRKKN